MARKKKEEVRISFHYLQRLEHDEKKKEVERKFSEDEFSFLRDEIKNKITPDIGDKAVFEKVLLGTDVWFENFKKHDDRTFSGTFKAPYSGHSYENSAKGDIPASSLNLRRFGYLVYLGKDGRIYLGCQYLGQFGSYYTLLNGIKRGMKSIKGVVSQSFRDDDLISYDLKPKEIEVQVINQPKSIAADSQHTQKMMLTLQRTEEGDEFETSARTGILPIFAEKSFEAKRKKLAKQIQKMTGLTSVKDEDIQNCKVVVDIDGRERTFYLFEPHAFATKYLLGIGINKDGHPHLEQLRPAMITSLTEKVLKKI